MKNVAIVIKHIYTASFLSFQVSTLENKVVTLEEVSQKKSRTSIEVDGHGLICLPYLRYHVFPCFPLQTVQRVSCSSNPCQNGGTCLNLLNSYHCICPGNWGVSSVLFFIFFITFTGCYLWIVDTKVGGQDCCLAAKKVPGSSPLCGWTFLCKVCMFSLCLHACTLQ